MAATPARSVSPDRSWQGVDRLLILAHLTGPLDPSVPADDFCDRVRRIAAGGAPFPVHCATMSEAMAAEASGAALIVVQGAIQPMEADHVLIVAARRTAAAGLEPGPIYFGAAPRAARLGSAGPEAADRALHGALAEILPWLGAEG